MACPPIATLKALAGGAKNMENEKTRAIERFITNRPEEIAMISQFVRGLPNNPDLMKDPGFRSYGRTSALTLYKLVMFGANVTPGDILKLTRKIGEEISARNGIGKFIQQIVCASEEIGIFEMCSKKGVGEPKELVVDQTFVLK